MSKEQHRERKRAQEEIQAHSAASAESAREAERLVEELQSREFLEEFRDLGLEEWLDDELGPEASPVWAIANESGADYRRHRFLNENRAERVIAEHSPGRLCRGPLLELAQEINDRPDQPPRIDLTDQERRHIREAEHAKTSMQSLGRDARGLRSITEAINTVRSESSDSGGGDDSGGRVRGALAKVFR